MAASRARGWGLLSTAVRRLLLVAASLQPSTGVSVLASEGAAPGLWSTGSGTAWSVFPDQGSSPHLLHWEVNALLLSRQGSPEIFMLTFDLEVCKEKQNP